MFVLDASRGGLRVAHQAQLPTPGSVCRIDLPSEVGPIRLDCAIVHTVIQHAASAAKNLFNSGLQIVSVDTQSAERMNALIATGEPQEEP